jgi:hypothetical protein
MSVKYIYGDKELTMTATSASGIDRESRKSPDQFSVEMVIFSSEVECFVP